MFNAEIKSLIDYVIYYVGNSCNDWFIIKQQIVNHFPPIYRSLFSRRHYSTKKHILNSFDYQVITYWKEKTGNDLWINPNKLHPKDWKRKPKGWALKEINEERRKNPKALNQRRSQKTT